MTTNWAYENEKLTETKKFCNQNSSCVSFTHSLKSDCRTFLLLDYLVHLLVHRSALLISRKVWVTKNTFDKRKKFIGLGKKLSARIVLSKYQNN